MKISFANFDDLTLAHETGVEVNVSAIRDNLENLENDDDSAEIVYYGRDGNDSFVVDTGDGFAWFVLSNIVQPGPVMGDVCSAGKTETMLQALQHIFDVALIDNEGR